MTCSKRSISAAARGISHSRTLAPTPTATLKSQLHSFSLDHFSSRRADVRANEEEEVCFIRSRLEVPGRVLMAGQHWWLDMVLWVLKNAGLELGIGVLPAHL